MIASAGNIDIDTTPRLRESLREAIQTETDTSLTVDLTSVDFIDSAGLGALVWAHKQLAAQDRSLSLVIRQDGQVARVMRMTGLDRLFSIVTQ